MEIIGIWAIVEFSGYEIVEGFRADSIDEAMELARDNWDEDVKITFVKAMDSKWVSQIDLLCEMERDGRFIARRAAQIVRREMSWSHRFHAA